MKSSVHTFQHAEYLSSGKPPLEVGSGPAERDWAVLPSACWRQVGLTRHWCWVHQENHIRKLLLKDNTCFKTHICSVLQRKWYWIPQLVLNSLIILSFWPFSLNMERELGSLILATDISRQNDYLSKFRLHLDQENLCLSNASHRHFLLQVGVLLGHHTQLLHLRKNCELLFCFCFFCPPCTDGSEVCGHLQPLQTLGAEQTVERESDQGVLPTRFSFYPVASSYIVITNR